MITQPRGKAIQVIAENLSAYKRQQVKDFLAAHPKIQLHFTPAYSSWLNQVELWFGRIERRVITRGLCTSVSDLRIKTYALHPSLQQDAAGREMEIR